MPPTRLTFCGASSEVSGSCYYLESGHSRIVIDCGAFQGSRYADSRNSLPFPFEPKRIDAVLITHAHYDHVGRLPKLVKDGFNGPVFATAATAELAELTLIDSAHIIEEECKRHGGQPLFTEEDVLALRTLWRPINYHQNIQVAAGIQAVPVNAGHILGSVSFAVQAGGIKIAFSGDLGNSPTPLLQGTEYLHGAQYAVVESTYATRSHEVGESRLEILIKALEKAHQRGGTLVIPAFAVERSQELLYLIKTIFNEKPHLKIPVYLDSPLAIAATKVFEKHHELLAPQSKNNLFDFHELHFTETAEQSKQINSVKGPHIIIAGSGMMNGGRILHHLVEHLGNPNDQLLILGYQADGTLGQQLQQGEEWAKVYHEHIRVQAEVTSSGAFSGHADRPRLLRWVEELRSERLKSVFVVHGEQNTAAHFSDELRDLEDIMASVPLFGESAELSS